MKMNNKFLSIIIILILASFTILVSAEWEEGPTEDTVHLTEGWNIISFNAIDEKYISEETDVLQKRGITAVFMYNPFDKEYIRLYPNFEIEKMKQYVSELKINEQRDTLRNMAIWVYSNKEQDLRFNTMGTTYSVSLMDLKKGWNFLAITNVFKDEINWDFTFDEYKGTCDIQKIYLFFYYSAPQCIPECKISV